MNPKPLTKTCYKPDDTAHPSETLHSRVTAMTLEPYFWREFARRGVQRACVSNSKCCKFSSVFVGVRSSSNNERKEGGRGGGGGGDGAKERVIVPEVLNEPKSCIK
jgi:hypothetical protein